MSVSNLLVPNNYHINVGGFTAGENSIIDMGSNKIINVANGTASTDAVNLSQVNAIINGKDKFMARPQSDLQQTLSTNSTTKINLNGFSLTSPNFNQGLSQYTVPTTGIYKFSVSLGIQFSFATDDATTIFPIQLARNGSMMYQFIINERFFTGTFVRTGAFEWMGQLNAGDIITVQLAALSGTGAVSVTNLKTVVTQSGGVSNNTYLIGEQL